MRLAIVARRTPKPEPQHARYRDEAQRRGHVVVDIDVACFVSGPLSFDVAPSGSQGGEGFLRIGDQRLDDPNLPIHAVLLGPLPGASARTSPPGTTLSAEQHALLTLAQHERHLLATSLIGELEARGIPVLSPSSSLPFDAKPAQLFALARAGLPLPRTQITDHDRPTKQGPGERGAVDVVKAIRGGPVRLGTPLVPGRPMIVQEHLIGDDLRAVVVGGRCLVVARFPASDAGSDDPRDEPVDVRERPGFIDGSARWLRDDDEAAAALAVRAARVCHVDVAAVDLKRTAQGLFVLEVNRTPVMIDIDDDLDAGIAAVVIDLVEARAGEQRA